MILTVLALLIAGCSEDKSVAHYKRYPEERAARMQECLAAGDKSQECRNVKQAELEILGIPAKDGAPL